MGPPVCSVHPGLSDYFLLPTPPGPGRGFTPQPDPVLHTTPPPPASPPPPRFADQLLLGTGLSRALLTPVLEIPPSSLAPAAVAAGPGSPLAGPHP